MLFPREVAFRRTLAVWLLIALALRLANPFTLDPPISDERSYLAIASNLVRGEGFREDGVWAYRYPAYVALLAGCFALFGEHRVPIAIIQALMGTACVLLLALVVRRRLGDVAALFSAGAFALYVPFVRLPGRLYTENLFFLLLLLVWLVTERPGCRHLGWSALAGFLSGLAVLTREVFIPMLGCYALLRWVLSKDRNYESKQLAILVACAVLTVAPWTLRNYLLFERVIPVTSNGWFNVYMGNSPIADGKYPREKAGKALWEWPSDRPRSSPYLEVDLADYFRAEVFKFWKENTSQALRLVATKTMLLITPPHLLEVTMTRGVSRPALIVWSGMWVLLWALALYGYWRGPVRVRDALWPYVLLLVTIAACLATYVIARYRFPMELALIYFASNGYIALLTSRPAEVGEREAVPPSPT